MKNYTQSTLERKTKSNLAKILFEEYGRDVDPEGQTNYQLIELITDLQEERQAQFESGVLEEERVKLTLHSDGTVQGSKPQPVGVNGRMYTIPRDKEVEVPKSVVNVLQDAVQTFMESTDQQGADGNVIYNERDAQRFAMTVKS